MNPFEMVVLIVFIVMVDNVLRGRRGLRRMRGGEQPEGPSVEERAETMRLRDEVKALKDRIHVLERIVTDRGVETAAQIEALRERDQIGAEDKA